jgi:glycosyltransferase involved in cell wall biosynthesis
VPIHLPMYSPNEAGLHILMLNRADAHSVPGGDTVQMLQTKAGLEKLGVQVALGSVQDSQPVEQYDLVHVFNWQQLEQLLAIDGLYARHVPPIVLSPIFWFYTGHWFDAAVDTKQSWKLLDKQLGSHRARKLYENWQQLKFRYGPAGRRLRQSLTVPQQLMPNSCLETAHLESVLGLQGKLQSRCTIVPNAVRRDLYDPQPLPSKAFLEQYGVKGFVLQVARIQAAKNQLGLMEALFDLSIPIVFIGQPSPYEPEYVNRCYDRARKRGQVYFLGPMPAEELAAIYALAAVHVLPSWRETPGLVSLEAAAAGCRIVSTSIGSAYEYFGDLAWYCDPRNAQSIRRAVQEALATPPSEKLRKLVLERYTWEAASAATLKAYRLALSGKGEKE